MNILLTGALSWNPERVIALTRKGHRLFGLWSRTMAWEQGPYAFAEGIITDLDVESSIDLLRDRKIDIIYSLFQVYDARLWGRDAAAGVEDLWSQLRRLLAARSKGAFQAPIVRHWGFDVHHLDLEVVRALDGQIFCNRQKLRYWTSSRSAGGCGLDLGCDRQAIAFMDSDLPWREFLNDHFSPKLSDRDGEIHTVCLGRPVGIDLVQAASNRIHVHIYGNQVDDLATIVSHGLTLTGLARLHRLGGRYIHLHPPIQPLAGTLAAIRAAKDRWVEEFSRYDAGWSYVKRPFPWPRLEDEAAIPNRLGTYLLAGLPIIAERLPGYDRYDSLDQNAVAIDFSPSDYSRLAVELGDKSRLSELGENARRCRASFTFDATIDSLTDYFQAAHDRYRMRGPGSQPTSLSLSQRMVHLHTRPVSLRNIFQQKPIPGGWWERLGFGLRLARSRVKWSFASVIGRVYVRRVLRQCQTERKSRSG
jgi:hypothetical protein